MVALSHDGICHGFGHGGDLLFLAEKQNGLVVVCAESVLAVHLGD